MTRQDLGRATETRFLLDAQTRGLIVSKPACEAPGYDAIVDARGHLLRVQVKGVRRARRTQYYQINVDRHGRRTRYDILAVYLDGDGRWIFFPFKAVAGYGSLMITPSGKWLRRAKGWEILG